MTVEKKTMNVSLFPIDFSPQDRVFQDPMVNNRAKIGIILKYDNGKLYVMVRHASNLVKLKISTF